MLWAVDRRSRRDDFPADLNAAAGQERPHFIAHLQERVQSRSWLEPIRFRQADIVFDDVRNKHHGNVSRSAIASMEARRQQLAMIASLFQSECKYS